MGRAARMNPRSLDGHKWSESVNQHRLSAAPLSTLVATWFRLMWRKVRHG